MHNNSDKPMIVQGDMTILLEVNSPLYAKARDALAVFAELRKSPDYMHTYAITPLSLWNAAASGHGVSGIKNSLHEYSKYEVPPNVITEIEEYTSRFGKLKLLPGGENNLILKSEDPYLMPEIKNHKSIKSLIEKEIDESTFTVSALNRGDLKSKLINIGFPAEDLAGYRKGEPYYFNLRDQTENGENFSLRTYQKEAADIFWASGTSKGGSGTVVLPCGAGKTIVGMASMHKAQTETLILVTNNTAAKQWKRELLDKTDIKDEDIGEYSGERKEIRPVTIATYQIIVYRDKKKNYPHFEIFGRKNWGMIVYDEVHLLPAPVFRITAGIQATRRLGLTATLIREDGKEKDVFSLIGPKKYDVPWKTMEKQGWIAAADCTEIRVDIPDDRKMEYAVSTNRSKIRISGENPEKIKIAVELMKKHKDRRILIIGQYISQLEELAHETKTPLITGKTKNEEREKLYRKFRNGEIEALTVSKVGNFSVDLPDANICIQVSGTFGSRQEEAQRLGRILRPKKDGRKAHFYTIVTKNSRDQDFASNRQKFLTEQGYSYFITSASELLKEGEK
ncbi:MAG: DNA repair helicase XPB [Fibrobacterota bacterium]